MKKNIMIFLELFLQTPTLTISTAPSRDHGKRPCLDPLHARNDTEVSWDRDSSECQEQKPRQVCVLVMAVAAANTTLFRFLR